MFAGDFFQLNPVGKKHAIYVKQFNPLWEEISTVIFLNDSYFRYRKDPTWGFRLHNVRLGLMEGDDYDVLDSRVVGPTLKLPETMELNGRTIS